MHVSSILTPVHFHPSLEGNVVLGCGCINQTSKWTSSDANSHPRIMRGNENLIQEVNTVPIVKYDTYRSSGGSNERIYESGADPGRTRNLTLRRLERRLWELRLNRALRRFQEQIRTRIQRRCELRMFVILRVQFIYRARSRARAALTIQRFMRRMKEAPKVPYFY